MSLLRFAVTSGIVFSLIILLTVINTALVLLGYRSVDAWDYAGLGVVATVTTLYVIVLEHHHHHVEK